MAQHRSDAGHCAVAMLAASTLPAPRLQVLLPIIRANIQEETFVMTDEASWYRSLRNTFADHETVNHSDKQYVRSDFTWHGGTLSTIKIHYQHR